MMTRSNGDKLVMKEKDEFRNYNDSNRQEVVQRHYKLMRQNQTLEFVHKMEAKYLTSWGKSTKPSSSKSHNALMTISEAFEALEGYVDSSDPDSNLPNLEHMLQTAEGIREAGHPDWFVLVGLIHDMGKIQYLWGEACDGQEGTATGDQWALGGDTWVVGCEIPASVVFPKYNDLNADTRNEALNSELGIYTEGCGISALTYAWGHDEYLYQMLRANRDICTIPEEGLAMIRFHSCYPWHRDGEYRRFMTEGDEDLLEWVLEFNKFDLYTKADKRPNVKELWPYYQSLIDKYLPGKLKW